MVRQNTSDSRCEALFASALQRSDALSVESIKDAISRTLRQLGEAGCASQMAQEFGDHPEAACERMQWARQLVDGLTPSASELTRPTPSASGLTAPASNLSPSAS
jgi:hypothetical protein